MPLIVRGGRPLSGEVSCARAKNAALPLLAAALLTKDEVLVRDLPAIRDIQNMLSLLACYGVRADALGKDVCLRAQQLQPDRESYDCARSMRASVLLLGPLLARCGQARLALPGGCAIGQRPIDLHIAGLRALGAEIELCGGELHARAPDGLHGARICLDVPSVGATENLLLAASLAKGETLIENAAREPEIENLIELLRAMGARMYGAGQSTLRVEGVPGLHGAQVTPIFDRIEAGTLLMMAAASGGEVFVRGAEALHLRAPLQKLRESGACLREEAAGIFVSGGKLRATDLRTQCYPGFPTDLQAPMLALLCRAQGSSILVESIFENRFQHVPELKRMGAQITVRGQVAVVRGVERLCGAHICAQDLRGGAALVLAALCAEGQSQIDGLCHIDRGYDGLDQKLRALGADIIRS